jgi:thiol-disulfide isomerase/thioredoxin
VSAGKAFVLLILGAALGAGAGAALWFSPVSTVGVSSRPSSAVSSAPITAAPAPVVGAPAPDFSSRDLRDKPFNMASLRGTAVLLNFWATWCDPCREELPLLDGIQRKYPASLRVVGVETGEAESEVRSFAQSLSLNSMTVLLDPSFAARDLYLVRGLPTSYFIDTDGVVQHIKIGTLDAAEIDSILVQMGVAP